MAPIRWRACAPPGQEPSCREGVYQKAYEVCDPAISLKLSAEARFERYQPSVMTAVYSRSFRDALQRMARYKKLTRPEDIRARVSLHLVGTTSVSSSVRAAA